MKRIEYLMVPSKVRAHELTRYKDKEKFEGELFMPREGNVTSFETRLKKYGLTENDILADELRVTKDHVIHLGGAKGTKSHLAPHNRRPKDAKEMKRWIGTPDVVLEKKPALLKRRTPEELPPDSLMRDFKEVHKTFKAASTAAEKKRISAQLDRLLKPFRKEIRGVARAYLYGDSLKLSKYADLVAWWLRDLSLSIFPVTNVIIESGAVLEFDEAPNTLTADSLIIEEGGTLRSRGVLILNVSNLKRTV